MKLLLTTRYQSSNQFSKCVSDPPFLFLDTVYKGFYFSSCALQLTIFHKLHVLTNSASSDLHKAVFNSSENDFNIKRDGAIAL